MEPVPIERPAPDTRARSPMGRPRPLIPGDFRQQGLSRAGGS